MLFAVALGLLGACDKPKVNSWRDFTGGSNYDPIHIERAQVDDARATALATRGAAETSGYGYVLARFIWEQRDLFAAVERAAADPEYSFEPPASIAGFDRAAHVADYVMLAKEVYARVGSPPLDAEGKPEKYPEWLFREYAFTLALATNNCELMREDVAERSVCDNQQLNFERVDAVCEPDAAAFGAMCRKIFDAMPELDDRYYLMVQCGGHIMPGKEREGAATWATAEEMAFYDKMVAKRDFEQVLAAGNRAAAAEENRQRKADYAQDQADYEASKGAIENVSQIGSLDDEGRPVAPEMVEVRGFTAPPTGSVDVTSSVTISSSCAENLELGTHDGGPSLVVEAGSTFSITVPTCTQLCLFAPQRRELGCARVSRTANYEILPDCNTLHRLLDLEKIGAP
ncbi:hypothetical protein [Enhygromyxa salina]|uniref:hypothetical protein n=1 Tax=Enhygromyxa salina TaxID=215803 RepID=UPI000697A883|nr:hypothetical protein [Enhygromyxa salina]